MTAPAGTGTLYLVPVGLGEAPLARFCPPEVAGLVARLDYFVVENPKAARAELKRFGHPLPLRELEIRALPERPRPADLDALLDPVAAGRDGGLMSDAGCPAVADPGAALVGAAHRRGVRVAPLVGPSSLLLALMGSGLNGQRFAFHGYLPVEERERNQALRALEAQSALEDQTQIFIETPYRNARLFDALLAVLKPQTRLCVACDLSTERESIRSADIAAWRRAPAPELDRRPSIFLILAH